MDTGGSDGMIGTHTSKKKRDVPHVYKCSQRDHVCMFYNDRDVFEWVCEHGIHCAHGKSNVDARRWFRMIYGY